ncbi:MAG: HAD family hydrolase [Selenomonadaceae bacterium]|nr:HAD family hydrolase [Selenomonadaceae bacterium]
MIKLFATDLDGTLLISGKPIAKENIEAAKYAESKGVTVAIATGRMYRAALPIARELGVDAPIITYNGALIKSASGKVFYENYIKEELALEAIEIARENNWHLQIYSDDELFYPKENELSKTYESVQTIKGNAVGWEGLKEHTAKITKILTISLDQEESVRRRKIFEDTFKNRLTVTSSTAIFAELTNLGVSKASGLRELAKILNVSIEETMAIGDADNDLPMLKAAGKSVAMGNAAAHIKEAADFVTTDCKEHGFANAIYKFVLGEG